MSRFIDVLSHFLAHRKGLLPLSGCAMVIANFMVRLAAPHSWLASCDLLLHLGVITSIFGLLLARAL